MDDGNDNVHDLIPENEEIKYINLDEPQTIGNKRNIAIGASKGEVIIHWDDDDWFASNRLLLQVHYLTKDEHEINGLSKIIFLDIDQNRSWLYEYKMTHKPWLAGGGGRVG